MMQNIYANRAQHFQRLEHTLKTRRRTCKEKKQLLTPRLLYQPFKLFDFEAVAQFRACGHKTSLSEVAVSDVTLSSLRS